METIDLAGKRVLVLGTAKSGIAAARHLKGLGAVVTVNDGRLPSKEDQETLRALGVKTVYESHPASLLDEAELIVKNPGIPYSIPILEEAVKRGIPVWTEVELAFHATEADWIAITGSNGKTTTTTLVHELMKGGDRHVHLAGNIGFPAVEVAANAKKGDVIVIELSSFQLMGMDSFRPLSAAFLNLSPAHLDYHGDFEQYGEAKARIFRNMEPTDRLVVNGKDETVMRLSESAKAERVTFTRDQTGYAHLEDGMVMLGNEQILPVHEIALGGGHNHENVLAALALVEPFALPIGHIRQVLRTFGGVAHRTEYVGEFSGRKVYNDSKATNNVAAEAALSGFTSPIVWICGGLERGADLSPLLQAMDHVKVVIGMGETAERFAGLAKKKGIPGVVVSTMEEAVQSAFEHSDAGDIILLSPASASWDQYKTYEERGEHFVRLVKEEDHS